ncbi:MAG: nucleoside recognition domain-containing protein [Thermodesulfobacteriota bacterium]
MLSAMKQKASVINIIWFGMIAIATVTAAYTGTMEAVTKASFESAKDAVTLAIGLIGPMALWLGIMKVAEAGGLMRLIARGMRPLMTRLFPDVPAEHPAMSAMIMNLAANVLGLGNAATPMGIKAMQELDKLSAEKGTATNAMCLFLAINTSSVTLLPLGVITVRAAAGALNPAAIVLPSIFATTCSTVVAILVAKLLAKPDLTVAPAAASAAEEAPAEAAEAVLTPPGSAGRIFVGVVVGLFLGGILFQWWNAPAAPLFSIATVNTVSAWLIPLLIAVLLLFGYLRGVKVYEAATEGAKEGFSTAMRIVPFMVAIFVAIGMFRASGAMDIMVAALSPLTERVGLPAEALAMALLRPLSGSGAFGFMSEITRQAPDSFLAALVGVIQGSTETTFYVLAVYFGSIGVFRTRHALPAALCGETAGLIGALFICHLWFS